MDIAYIDQLANNGDGCLHKASVISKFLMTVSIIGAVVVSTRIYQLLSVLGILIVLNIINRLPLRKILHFIIYPVFFSVVFALMYFQYSFEAGFVIILKAVVAAKGMLLLITTTPYPQIFGILSRFLPGMVTDAMLFTYRIFFILLEKIRKSLIVIKLRGGFRPSNIIFNVKNLAAVIGIIFINAFDMSDRMYHIYALRGYSGNMMRNFKWYTFKRNDYIPITVAAIIIVLVVIL